MRQETAALRGFNPALTASGQKRTFGDVCSMSALPPKADIKRGRFACPLSANNGHIVVVLAGGPRHASPALKSCRKERQRWQSAPTVKKA
jgi:hypothetical protein